MTLYIYLNENKNPNYVFTRIYKKKLIETLSLFHTVFLEILHEENLCKFILKLELINSNTLISET